jgi:hypothetical protein
MLDCRIWRSFAITPRSPITPFGKCSSRDTSESGLPVAWATSPGGGNISKKAGQVKCMLPVYESDVNFGRSGLAEPLDAERGSRSLSKNLLVITGFRIVLEISNAKFSTLGRMFNNLSTSSSGIFWSKVRASFRIRHRDRSNSGFKFGSVGV